MPRTQVSRKAMLLVGSAVWLLAAGLAQAGDCANGMCSAGPPSGNWAYPGGLPITHCPTNWWCMPRPPRLCPKCVCPKPLCDPCELENYGYYPVCWRPWLQQVNWSHCPVPPPTVLAPDHNPRVDLTPVEPEEMLPPPNKPK